MPRPNLLRATGIAAVAALALGGAVVAAPGAQADAPSPQYSCATTTCTLTYYAGSSDFFTVPNGVHQLGILVAGGQGGGPVDDSAAGGQGATVSGTIAVKPGDKFPLVAGVQGEDGGGYPNFGGGGASVDNTGAYGSLNSGSGGGGSFVFDNAGHLLLAAGGGGGGTVMAHGGGGAGAGGTGASGASAYGPGYDPQPATGGSQDGAGSAGSNDFGYGGDGGPDPAYHFQWGQGGGGNVSSDGYSGGGGGGGYYGGGGGGYGDSGAGGSGFAAPSLTDVLSADGNHVGPGTVQISWRPVASVSISPDVSLAAPGDPVTLRADVYGIVAQAPTGTVSFTLGGAPMDGCTDVPVTDSAAYCDTTAMVEGINHVAAVYNGNDLYDSSTATFDYVSAYAPLGIYTDVVPAAATSNAYSVQLEGAGGDGKYTWQVSSGTLPDGVTLSPSGLLAGTPTQDGDYSFTVLLTDGRGKTTSNNYDLPVTVGKLSQSVAFTTEAPVDAVVNGSYTPSASASSELPVTFAVDSASTGFNSSGVACGVTGAVVHFRHAGTCVLDARQGGDGNYHPAADVSQQIVVGKAAQSITFATSVPSSVLMGRQFDLATSTAPTGLPALLSVDPATTNNACLVFKTIVYAVHAGNCVIAAARSGTGDYLDAPVQRASFAVVPVPDPVSFTTSAPTAATVGTQYTANAVIGTTGKPVDYTVLTPGAVCTVDGATVSFVHVGVCTLVAAPGGPAAQFPSDPASQPITVSAAATHTAVQVTRDTIVAHVTSSAPAGQPAGAVAFLVGGVQVGTAALVNGVATLHEVVPAGATRTVGAVFAGSADYTGSSASTSRRDPSIKASLSSAHPATRFGWYRAPVTVTFTCVTAGADLVGGCPAPVTLARHAGGQSVSRTIVAQDGGLATVAVRDVNIDLRAPSVRVAGVQDGATYSGTAPVARCIGLDGVSGIDTCTLVQHKHGNVVDYTATATDRAGNATTTRGHYTVRRV